MQISCLLLIAFALYLQIDPSREKFWIHVSSDAMRLALIWKYGGIWMDSDIISRQQIPHQRFLAAESNQRSSNGVFGFPSHHDFIWRSMEDFTRKYNSQIWGYQGPWLFTRILNTFCSIPPFKSFEDVMCGNITFLNPQRFYPVFYTDWERYYDVWTKEPTFNDSYALHLWNHFNNGEFKKMVPGSNTLVEHLYQQYCPSTYRDVAKKKSTV